MASFGTRRTVSVSETPFRRCYRAERCNRFGKVVLVLTETPVGARSADEFKRGALKVCLIHDGALLSNSFWKRAA